MSKEPRHSHVSLKVLKYFVEHPEARISGAEITKALGIASGTLYPILFRYEQVGWLQSEWEKCKPEEIGRPRRRLYRLGVVGSRRAIEVIEEVSFGLAGGPQWAPG